MKENLLQELNQFNGTNCYYHNPVFKHIYYTEGFQYFLQHAGNGAYWFLTIIATEIIPVLEADMYFIELNVSEKHNAIIKVQYDKDKPILYKKEITYTDCPQSINEPYKFCLDMNDSAYIILSLITEY